MTLSESMIRPLFGLDHDTSALKESARDDRFTSPYVATQTMYG